MLATLAHLTLSIAVFICSPLSAAEPLTAGSDFVLRLQEHHSAVVDGQPLRIAIRIVTKRLDGVQGHINTWLDRRVNPDTPVLPGSLGPTRYASLCAIADQVGCVCYPIDNCVVIGRPEWVAAICQAMYVDSMERRGVSDVGKAAQTTVHVTWPDLTTPGEALALVRKSSRGGAQNPGQGLPHDLWPETTWMDIPVATAELLIRSQFLDLPSRAADPFARSYQFGNTSPVIESIKKTDAQARAIREGGRIRLIATPVAHQEFCRQLLSSPAPGETAPGTPAADGDPLRRLREDARTFSFQVQNQPARAVLKTLLGATQIAYEFDAGANQRLDQLVSFSATDQSLWELVRLINQKASLKIVVQGDKLKFCTQ